MVSFSATPAPLKILKVLRHMAMKVMKSAIRRRKANRREDYYIKIPAMNSINPCIYVHNTFTNNL